MDNNEFDEVLRAHLEAVEPECRWSFAIDMESIKGEIIAQHDLPDAMMLHLSCLRCGGEWSEYIRGFTGEYLRDEYIASILNWMGEMPTRSSKRQSTDCGPSIPMALRNSIAFC